MRTPTFLSVADQRVAAAWAQLLAEDAAEWDTPPPALVGQQPRPVVRPAVQAVPAPASRARRGWRLPLALNGALLLAILLGLAGGPVLAALQLHQALHQPQAHALEELVDWPALRGNLQARLASPAAAEQPGFLAELTQEVAAGLATAPALHGWLQEQVGGTAARAWPVPLGASGVWQVTLGETTEGAVQARLVRDPAALWRWRLVDLDLPASPEVAAW